MAPLPPLGNARNVKTSEQEGHREELKPSSRRSRTKKGASHRLTLDKLSRRGAHLAPVQQEDRVGEELRTVPRA